MKERRQYARLNIPLPVRLETISMDTPKVLDLVTRNISYSGTFISTITSFPENTRFVMDFTIPTDNLEEFNDLESLMGCTGKMVRSTLHGIAIQFDKECQIESLKTL
jgi:hypothetical protein